MIAEFVTAPSPAVPLRNCEAIAAAHLIPDVLRCYSEVRPVFDRYGLRGCGGPLGPAETVGYFARDHAVEDLPAFLAALNAARGARPAAGPEPDRPEDSIYRRFFLAGIIATLTAGATWGAILLLRLAAASSFQALPVPEVNAHGHAQVFGWVGLFVMGFAFQAFPRFRHGSLPRPRLALVVFPAYLTGLVVRTVAEPFAASPVFLAAGLAGGALEIGSAAAFAWIVAEIFLRPRRPLKPSDSYILAATAWFLAAVAGDTVLFVLIATAPTPEVLVARVAAFQAPIRDIQLHGFALVMILGVAQRFLPGMLGLGRVPAGPSRAALAALTAGVLAEVAGFLALRLAGGYGWAAVLWAGTAAIAGASGYLAARLGVFGPSTEHDRSLKFVRAAFAWLGVSLAMLLLFPVYMAATGLGFSHAYFGTTRHAITVGFISLMILGVASKVVPTLNGVPASTLRPLWVPFALINAGCAMRVFFQTLTDLTPTAFAPAGASGVLEVAALAIWGVHIVRLILGRRPAGCAAPRHPGYARRLADGGDAGDHRCLRRARLRAHPESDPAGDRGPDGDDPASLPSDGGRRGPVPRRPRPGPGADGAVTR